jgi:hypothetical protein
MRIDPYKHSNDQQTLAAITVSKKEAAGILMELAALLGQTTLPSGIPVLMSNDGYTRWRFALSSPDEE